MKDITQDSGFLLESLEQHTKDVGYLGDPEHVQSLLRFAAMEFFNVLPETNTEKDVVELVLSIGRKRMPEFFGSRHNAGVRGWNKPGGVDVFVAKWAGVKAVTPTERLVGVFATMIDELMDLEIYAEEDGTEEEQWDWQVDEVFERYTMLFLGISLPEQQLLV